LAGWRKARDRTKHGWNKQTGVQNPTVLACAALSAAGASHGHLSVRRNRAAAGVVFDESLA